MAEIREEGHGRYVVVHGVTVWFDPGVVMGPEFLEHVTPDVVETHTTTLLYKARTGEVKELQVVQPLDPGQRTLNFKDLQILAREVANVLREDG